MARTRDLMRRDAHPDSTSGRGANVMTVPWMAPPATPPMRCMPSGVSVFLTLVEDFPKLASPATEVCALNKSVEAPTEAAMKPARRRSRPSRNSPRKSVMAGLRFGAKKRMAGVRGSARTIEAPRARAEPAAVSALHELSAVEPTAEPSSGRLIEIRKFGVRNQSVAIMLVTFLERSYVLNTPRPAFFLKMRHLSKPFLKIFTALAPPCRLPPAARMQGTQRHRRNP